MIFVRKDGFKREKDKAKKKGKKRRKKIPSARMHSFDVFRGQASASRFSSTQDLTQKWSPRRPGSPPVGKKLCGDGSLKATGLMLARKNANGNIWIIWVLEGEKINSTDARAQAREQKYMDHIVSLKANDLATLVLDSERASRKIWITWFLEGGQISSTDARARACKQKKLNRIVFL